MGRFWSKIPLEINKSISKHDYDKIGNYRKTVPAGIVATGTLVAVHFRPLERGTFASYWLLSQNKERT